MIRDLSPADYEAIARIHPEALPGAVPPTGKGLRHWIESHPERALLQTFVADEAGEVAGFAYARFNAWSLGIDDVAWIYAGVREASRGHGIGTQLWAAAEAYVLERGARKLETFALAGSRGETFTRARGFRQTRIQLIMRLDPRTADLSALPSRERDAVRDGFRLVPLREVIDRRRELHAVYAGTAADIPADDPEDNIGYEDWERETFSDPELSLDGSFVVMGDGMPVAITFMLVDDEARSARNEMTGTLADYRRRGLARLAKLAAIRWARDNGIALMGTENDGENLGMRRLNESLGYRVVFERAFLSRPARPS